MTRGRANHSRASGQVALDPRRPAARPSLSTEFRFPVERLRGAAPLGGRRKHIGGLVRDVWMGRGGVSAVAMQGISRGLPIRGTFDAFGSGPRARRDRQDVILPVSRTSHVMQDLALAALWYVAQAPHVPPPVEERLDRAFDRISEQLEPSLLDPQSGGQYALTMSSVLPCLRPCVL